ncbi:ComF family protein [Oceanobacillus piezotolerans]|uniref:ComF family protein n=1 Tax=Oceanobacillus piezotolerans TaxID=2448030 RepID=A0A498DJM0_9BACI|nr:ComF family protein [Oceanobacillus piezotolerans]RLL46662.1 ComF family protein [Oceanobacillus piezotolerans]
MECLWCMEEIIVEISWINLFQVERQVALCSRCNEQLEKITGARCKHCSRQSTQDICPDCKWWKSQEKGDPLEKNFSIFHYNDFMQAIIAKWKYRGDYVLGEIFEQELFQACNEQFKFLMKEAVVVPIPLSKERSKERCFNQAAMLAGFIPMEKRNILSRIHGEKQSKKTRRERISATNPFFMSESLNKPVLLVDDIYTTGTTLRHAASLLKANGSHKVYALTLVRG